MNNTRYEDFCNRMRVYRKRLGYNQADIGKELGISQNDYSKRENGLIMISYDNLKKLQEIGMDIDELVSGKRDDIDTKDLDELISDCESEELKDMTMRMVAECIKYYRVNDTKNKDNDTQNDRMFDFMLKQWDDFSMLEYVRHETHYSQEVMSEKLGLTRKKYRKYEKEIILLGKVCQAQHSTKRDVCLPASFGGGGASFVDNCQAAAGLLRKVSVKR